MFVACYHGYCQQSNNIQPFSLTPIVELISSTMKLTWAHQQNFWYPRGAFQNIYSLKKSMLCKIISFSLWQDVLCGISKAPFVIPHKIPSICILYWSEVLQVQIEKKGKKMKVARRYFIKWKFFLFVKISCRKRFLLIGQVPIINWACFVHHQ